MIQAPNFSVHCGIWNDAVAILDLQQMEQRRRDVFKLALGDGEFTIAATTASFQHFKFSSHEGGENMLVGQILFAATKDTGHRRLLAPARA